MRIKAVIIALGVVLALSNGLASAQPQRTDTCVSGIADAYRFMCFLVFDADRDLVGLSSSNTRSVHWSSGLLRGRHEVWVGCLRASSYTIQWVNGNEKRLGPARYVSYLNGVYLTPKPSPQAVEFDVHMEQILQWAHNRQLAAEQSEQ